MKKIKRKVKPGEPKTQREPEGIINYGFETTGNYLYVIEMNIVGCQFVKVGRSVDPYKRLKMIQVSSPVDLKFSYIIEDAGHLEEGTHKELIRLGLWVRGEWFRWDARYHVADYIQTQSKSNTFVCVKSDYMLHNNNAKRPYGFERSGTSEGMRGLKVHHKEWMQVRKMLRLSKQGLDHNQIARRMNKQQDKVKTWSYGTIKNILNRLDAQTIECCNRSYLTAKRS